VFGAGSDQALTITGTLADLAARIREVPSEMPGLLIIGDPAKHRYAHHGALEGRRVLLTASRALQDRAADQIRDYGGIPICRPLIELETTAGALEAVRRIVHYDWVVLTSPSSVRCFGELLRNAGVDLRTVPKIASCGGGTSRELKALGLAADLEPASDFSAESLLHTLTPLVKPGLRILRLRSDKAGPGLACALRALGAVVEECELYRNRAVRYDEKPEFEAAFFASASAVESYSALWGAASLKGVYRVALGKPTVAALHKLGMEADLIPPEATVESALTAVAVHFAQQALAIQRSYRVFRG
jgi:uroporphyrinogen-III synthase